MDPEFRLADANDFDKLWPLVEESLLQEESRVTRESLQEDMFGEIELDREVLAKHSEEPSIELDLNLATLHHPVCQAIIAQAEDLILGYLLFHQTYSPWELRGVFIDNVYVRPADRLKGIASRLLREFVEHCRAQKLRHIIYDSSRFDPDLKDVWWGATKGYGFRFYKGEDADWGISRIHYD